MLTNAFDMTRIKRLLVLLSVIICGSAVAQVSETDSLNAVKLATLSAGGQVFLEHYGGSNFGVRLQNAIDALPATGGIINCREVKGAQTMVEPVDIDKPVVIYLGEMVLTMDNDAGDNMFNIESNSVSVIGLGRSPNKQAKTAPTRLIMANNAGDELNGYHFYNRGYSVINLRGFDIEGVRTDLGCQYGSTTYPLNGAGGIYMEKPDPGTVYSANAISQVVIEDVYIESTKAHGIYLDTPILSTVKNVRVSGAGGHGIFVSGGTSLTLNSVYVSSANMAGIALYSLVYGTVMNSVAEFCGIGWWLRSVHSVTLLSPGVEQTYNLGQRPWKYSNPETNAYGMNLHTLNKAGEEVAISDVNESYATDFRGHGYLITGGSNVFISSPYCIDPGHSKKYQMYSSEDGSGFSTKTRFVKVVSTNDNSVISNPKTSASSGYHDLVNKYDIEIGDDVVGLCLDWNPETESTVTPENDGEFVTSDSDVKAPLLLESNSTLVKSGNRVFSDMTFERSAVVYLDDDYTLSVADNNRTIIVDASKKVDIDLPKLPSSIVLTVISKQSEDVDLDADDNVKLNGVTEDTYTIDRSYNLVKLFYSTSENEWVVAQ